MEYYKLMIAVICVVITLCGWKSSSATPIRPQPFYSLVTTPEGNNILMYNVENDYPLTMHHVVRREAPLDTSKENEDLKAAATGYGHGGGHGGGYGGGHGGYAPTSYVSYGARTGGYGAFSWYSDHPAGGGYGGYH